MKPPDSTQPAGVRYSRRQALAAAAVCATSIAGRRPNAALSQAGATPEATPAAQEFSGLVDIGGRSLHVETWGAGGPTIVLEAGALARSDIWSRDLHEPEGIRRMVLPGVARFSSVLTYDRPGTIGEVNSGLEPEGPVFHPSRSDPVPQPRTVGEVVSDLHALLQATQPPGPYVLVGHSMGGLAMRLYASTYPDEAAGMVLVDATHEDVWTRFKHALSPAAWDRFEILTVDNPELEALYPDWERLLRLPLTEDPGMARMRQARADSPLGPMPLTVLSHGIPFAAPFPDWPVEEMEGIMLALQQDLASLDPNARHLIATESGHNIHQDQPDLVIEAVREVVEAVRDPDTWAERAGPVSSDWPP